MALSQAKSTLIDIFNSVCKCAEVMYRFINDYGKNYSNAENILEAIVDDHLTSAFVFMPSLEDIKKLYFPTHVNINKFIFTFNAVNIRRTIDIPPQTQSQGIFFNMDDGNIAIAENGDNENENIYFYSWRELIEQNHKQN